MLFSHATASRIKTYKQCEFRYFLEYVIEYPPSRGSNIYSAKGSAFHEALEYWTNAILGKDEKAEIDYEKTLMDCYRESRLWEMDQRMPDKKGKPRGFPHPVEKTCESCPWATKDNRCKIADMAIDAVDGCPRPNFEDDLALIEKTLKRTDFDPLALTEPGPFDDPDDFKPQFVKKVIAAEYPFDDELGGVRVRGVIDLLVEDDEDTIEVIDYKTGKSMSYDKAFNDAQVRIYAAIVRKLFPQYKNVLVTLYYVRTNPVTVPLGPEDDELTIKSLQRRQAEILDNENPGQVRPTKYGFPCDWCVGYDNCVKIKKSFEVDGKFRLPTISCSFAQADQPCWGSIHACSDQEIDHETVREILYSCKGHAKVNGGGEYVEEPKEDDSDSPT